MSVDVRFFPEIAALVHELVVKNYTVLQLDGRSGRLTACELKRTIDDYGSQLVDITEEALAFADSYKLSGKQSEWAIDLPLWTLEEGQSDLTLSLVLSLLEDEAKLSITDLHVL